MANYNNLKSAIQSVIKANGNNEITGPILQAELLSMINTLGAGYQYVGVAQPSMNPGTPDARVMYLAYLPGTYVNFGGILVTGFCVLKYNTIWTKEDIPISSGGGGADFLTEPDDLTLETAGNTQVLKFANRDTASGKGFTILRKDKTFAEQVTAINTFYEIRYNFNLNESIITLPAGAVLCFNGGSISNGVLAANITGNQILCFGKYAIFDEVYLSGMFLGTGYDWMTVSDSHEDYLKFSNLCHFQKGIIEQSNELNIDWWVNPFNSRWPSLPLGIEVNSIDIDGRGCRINMLAADNSTEKPFDPNQTDYTWGIDLLHNFIYVIQNPYTKGCFMRNLIFIDNKAINGAGSDLTIDKFTYNGHTGYVRSCFIELRTEQYESQCPVEFSNIKFYSRHGFIYNSGGVSNSIKHGEDKIIVNNCEFTSQGTFPFEFWRWSTGNYTSPRFGLAKFNGCKFELLGNIANLLSNPNVYKQIFISCEFISDYVMSAVEIFSTVYHFQDCKFINVSPGASIGSEATEDTSREFINCNFIENTNAKEGQSGKFWIYGGKGKIKFHGCRMFHDFYQPSFVTSTIGELEIIDSVFEMVRRAPSDYPASISKKIHIINSQIRNKGIVGITADSLFSLYIPRAEERIIDITNIEKHFEFSNYSRYTRTGVTESLLSYAKDMRVWAPKFDTDIVSGLRSDGYLESLSSSYSPSLVGAGSELAYTFNKFITICCDIDNVCIPEAYTNSLVGRFSFNFTIGNYRATINVSYSPNYKNTIELVIANINDSTEYFTIYYPMQNGKHVYAISISRQIGLSVELPTIITYCDGNIIAPIYVGNSSKINLFSGFGNNTISSININAFSNTGVAIREIALKNFVTQQLPETYATQ